MINDDLLSVIEYLPTAILVVDKENLICAMNKDAESILGIDASSLLGLCLTQIMKPTQGNSFQHLEPSIRSHIKPLYALQKDVDTLLYIEIASKSYDENYQLLTLHDVSDREAAIHTLQSVQEINNTGSWSFDLQTNQVWWSPELFHIFELPVSDYAPPYDTHKSLFTNRSWERLQPAVEKASKEGLPYELELELRKTTDSHQRRVAVARCEPILDTSGNVVKLIGTFQDITELAAARSDRDKLLERLTLAKKAAGFGIWEWNMDTDELVWDQDMHDIYGFSSTTTRYDDWRRVVHPDDIDQVEHDMGIAIGSNGIFNTTFRMRRFNKIRHILAFAVASKGRLVGINMDVTEQVAFREEARKINNLESLGVLAGGIAHDFNNLLAGISARADLLSLQNNDAAFVAEKARELQLSVDNAKGLTKQLLTFAKGGVPNKESASIENIIRNNVEFSLRGAPVSVGFDFDDFLWNVNVDPHQIGQVIQNIIINALQAMAQSGGNITIQAQNAPMGDQHPVLEAGNYIKVTIADNGPGISDDSIARVFDPYFTTKSQGNGLGLAICYSIIKQHKGTIDVTSTVGKGTCFTIYLPMSSGPTNTSEDSFVLKTGSGNILIVDDMMDVLTSMGMMVEALGYNVHLCNQVDQAVESYVSLLDSVHGFDLVITDLTMPGSGGGVELMERLKQEDPDVRVIVASGYANHDTFSKAEETGFLGRLTKPCTVNELGDEIERVLSLKAG